MSGFYPKPEAIAHMMADRGLVPGYDYMAPDPQQIRPEPGVSVSSLPPDYDARALALEYAMIWADPDDKRITTQRSIVQRATAFHAFLMGHEPSQESKDDPVT